MTNLLNKSSNYDISSFIYFNYHYSKGSDKNPLTAYCDILNLVNTINRSISCYKTLILLISHFLSVSLSVCLSVCLFLPAWTLLDLWRPLSLIL